MHHAEVEALAVAMTGCDHALVSGHMSTDQARQHQDLAPITFVHSDFAPSYLDLIRGSYRSARTKAVTLRLPATGSPPRTSRHPPASSSWAMTSSPGCGDVGGRAARRTLAGRERAERSLGSTAAVPPAAAAAATGRLPRRPAAAGRPAPDKAARDKAAAALDMPVGRDKPLAVPAASAGGRPARRRVGAAEPEQRLERIELRGRRRRGERAQSGIRQAAKNDRAIKRNCPITTVVPPRLTGGIRQIGGR